MSSRRRHQKRTRASISCDNCRTRKIRCDCGYPACARCIETGNECIYTALPRKSISDANLLIVKDRMDTLQQKIKHLEEIQYTGPRDRSSFFSFSDRLAALKTHTSINQKNYTPYTSNVYSSMVSRQDISNFSRILEYPNLWEYLEMRSYDFWRCANANLADYNEAELFFCPDAKYLAKCKELYSCADSPYIRELLSWQELSSLEWNCLSDNYQRAIISIILIIGSIYLTQSPELGDFTRESVRAHKNSAFFQALRSLDGFAFSGNDILGINISVLMLWCLIYFTSFPSAMRYLSQVWSMARVMCLDRGGDNKEFSDGEAKLPRKTWYLLCKLYDCLVIPGSLEPLASLERDSMYQVERTLAGFDMEGFKQSTIVSNFYSRYLMVATIEAREDSLDPLLRLDADLDYWKNRLHGVFGLDSSRKETWLPGFFPQFSLTDLMRKYYHMRILINSICAFRFRMFQTTSLNSLEKLAEAARALLGLETSTLSKIRCCPILQNNGITAAFFCLFCKSICYPDELTNYDDLLLLQKKLITIKSNLDVQDGTLRTSYTVWTSLVDIMARFQQRTQQQKFTKSYSINISDRGTFSNSDSCSTM